MPEQNSITIGSKVRVNLNNEIKDFEIVGSAEVNANQGKISYLSPLGEALLGKAADYLFEINLTNGKKLKVKILEVI